MNAMILLAQGAMNMADSLATANPVLTEVNAPLIWLSRVVGL